MRRRGLALALGLLLGACFDPAPPPAGLPCGAAGWCPAGQACGPDGVCHAAGAGDAAVGGDDAARADAPAGTDAAACPASPDEDGDQIGNGCDVCPHRPDPDQADGDGDGIGDACDPRPSQPGDRLLLFVGFDQDTTDLQLDPGWRVGGGRLTDTDATDIGYARWPLPSAVGDLSLDTRARVVSGTFQGPVFVSTGPALLAANLVDDIRCLVRGLQNSSAEAGLVILAGAGNTTSIGQPVIGTTARFRLQRRTTQLSCVGAVELAGGDETPFTRAGVDDRVTPAFAAVRSQHAEVEVDYLVVYDSPP